jgi:hypothetical protein
MTRERDTFDMFEDRPRGRFGDGEASDTSIRCNADARSDIIDLTLEAKANRPLAIAVVDPAKPGASWVWLPKSKIEIETRGSGVVVVSLPSWLAKEKGLI